MCYNSSMKFLHVHSGNPNLLSARLLANIAKSEKRSDHAFTFCTHTKLTEELIESKNTVEILGEVKLSRPHKVLLARRRLKKIVTKGDFDAVICHDCWAYSIFVKAAEDAGAKTILWAHETWKNSHLFEILTKIHPPQYIITNSKHTAQSLKESFIAAKMESIYYPVDPPPLLEAQRNDLQRVRTQFGTSENDFVILIGSTMERWLGHDLLLKAFAQLPPDVPCKVWVAGAVKENYQKTYFDELREIVSENHLEDKVVFIGERSDFSSLIGAVNLHVFANTLAVPFSFEVVEGLYSGIPTIASNLGGPGEIITPDCGRVVKPGSTGELKEALIELTNDRTLTKSMASSAVRRAYELCDPLIVHQRLDSFVRNL